MPTFAETSHRRGGTNAEGKPAGRMGHEACGGAPELAPVLVPADPPWQGLGSVETVADESLSLLFRFVGEPTSASFPELGQVISTQFQKTCKASNIFNVLLFGTLLQRIKEALVLCHAHDSIGNGRGRYAKGSGLKAWLEGYAPEVARPTAYKYMETVEAIRFFFERDQGTEFDFFELVFAPAGSLSEPMRRKHRQLVEMVEGTSQRHWLDRYRALNGAVQSPFAIKVGKFSRNLCTHLNRAEAAIMGFLDERATPARLKSLMPLWRNGSIKPSFSVAFSIKPKPPLWTVKRQGPGARLLTSDSNLRPS